VHDGTRLFLVEQESADTIHSAHVIPSGCCRNVGLACDVQAPVVMLLRRRDDVMAEEAVADTRTLRRGDCAAVALAAVKGLSETGILHALPGWFATFKKADCKAQCPAI
jgi:hypothetical protein